MKIITMCMFFCFIILNISGQNVKLSEGINKNVFFDVANVDIAKNILSDTSYKAAIENRIGKEIYVFPDEFKNDRLISSHEMNSFIQTVYYSYSEHRPLILSPDAIWLLICQGFSIHINENFSNYKDKIFKNQDRVTLRVSNDSLVTGNSIYWNELISELSNNVKEYTKDNIYSLLVPNYSTTGMVQKTAYEVNLLETSQKSFEYVGESGCGIPKIKLLGTLQDWEQIYNNVDEFSKYDLNEWVENLKPILKEFVEAYKGKINKEFWNTMYKDYTNYNIFYISGWVIKFFPYTKEYTYQHSDSGSTRTFKYIKNEYLKGENFRLSKLTTDDFPSGYSKVPVIFENINPVTQKLIERKDMELFAGFLGMRQDKNTKALTPAISWAVCDKNASKVDFYISQKEEKIKHSDEKWYPDTIQKPDNFPIYAPKINKDYNSGIKFLENYIRDTLKTLNYTNYKAFEIDFVLTYANTIAKVNVKSENKEICNKINSILLNLPNKWKQSRSKLYDMETEKMLMHNTCFLIKLEIKE